MTKNNSVMLKTYNQSDIVQLGICTVKLRHENKCVRCRFFVVPGNGPALLGIPDIELLSILRITCDIRGELHENKKFYSKAIDISSSPSCKANETPQMKTDRVDMHGDKKSLPD